MLVRGTDKHNNFAIDSPPPGVLDDEAVVRWSEADAQMKANFKQS